MNLNETGG